MKKTISQKRRVMRHLERYGKIDPIKAWNTLGVYRLAAVICELRKDGVEIETTDKDVKNRYGEKCTVAEYVYGR